jgi:hypothetical protein
MVKVRPVPEVVAAAEMTTVVPFVTDVMVAPAGIPVPTMLAPTSPVGPVPPTNVAEAEVTVVDPDVVTPSVTVRARHPLIACGPPKRPTLTK